MAPTAVPRTPSINHLRQILSGAVSHLKTRDVTSSAAPLSSIFALVLKTTSTVSRRALTSLADLPRSQTEVLTYRSSNKEGTHLLLKRQNAILAIPTTYKNLNSGPAPGAIVGIMLGSIFGFLLILWIIIISSQFISGRSQTVVKEEIIIDKRRSRSSKARSKRSSHHSAAIVAEHISMHEPSPPPPPRSRRETIVEIEEEYIRRPARHSPSPEPDEVIVEEEETTISDEIVEVIEEQSSISIVSPSPPPRKPSAGPRRSGFRTVDPAEFGGGDAPMRRMSRRSSGRGS